MKRAPYLLTRAEGLVLERLASFYSRDWLFGRTTAKMIWFEMRGPAGKYRRVGLQRVKRILDKLVRRALARSWPSSGNRPKRYALNAADPRG